MLLNTPHCEGCDRDLRAVVPARFPASTERTTQGPASRAAAA